MFHVTHTVRAYLLKEDLRRLWQHCSITLVTSTAPLGREGEAFPALAENLV